MKLLLRSFLITQRYISVLVSIMLGGTSTVFAQFNPPLPGGAGIPVPSSNINSIDAFYNIVCSVTQWVMVFGLILGVLFIIFGGVRYITSGGDDSKAKDAKGTILTALVGVVFLLLAVGIIRMIAAFFGGDLSGFKLSSATCR